MRLGNDEGTETVERLSLYCWGVYTVLRNGVCRSNPNLTMSSSIFNRNSSFVI
jgi:hypothetical protein